MRRPFVWQAGAGDGALLGRLDPGVVAAVAVAQAGADPALLTGVRRRGLGLLLDGEAWRAQGDPALRPAGFGALPWVDATAAHAPDRWSPSTCEDFAEAYVEHQAEVATLLTTPGHDGTLRRDFDLAALCADHVRARALREPAPGDPTRTRRALAATIQVRADGFDARWLTEAYSELDVDLYLVRARWFAGDEGQTRRLFAFARDLRERSGREVLLAGLGELWQAALASDVAGVVCARRGDYHGAILGSAEDEVARRRLYMRHPCPCGEHPAGAQPDDPAAHNLWWALREARQAAAPDLGRAQLLLAVRAAAAARSREQRRLVPLPSGWRVLGDVGDVSADDAGPA